MVVRCQHVLREASVGSESHELPTAAELLIPLVALPARAVAPIRIDYDEFALRDGRFRYLRAYGSNRPADFVSWDEGQVTYVWVDALINYLSALTYARDGDDLRDRFWPNVRHLLGKDILRFHCVYWPALLLAAGYDVPKQLFVHGWLLLDERKISKSLGNAVDPLDLVDVYGADAVRFWALRSVSFGQDGNASLEGLHERYERELGNDLGNLVSRTTAMIARYRDGRIAPGRANEELRESIEALRGRLVERFDAWDLTGALEEIWELVRRLNRYVESTAPCAIGLPWRWPSSASRQVPSAPAKPDVPVAYSSMRCSPPAQNVTMR